MAKVHTAKAAKDYPAQGIKKGDTYWWCKPYRQAKRRFKTPPRRPSLTMTSGWLSAATGLGERLEDLTIDRTRPFNEVRDELKDEVSQVIDEFQGLADEAQSSFDNLPENFQQGEQGEVLEQRAAAAGQMADNLGGVDFDIEIETATEVEAGLGGIEELQEQRTRDAFDQLDSSLAEAQQYSYEGE